MKACDYDNDDNDDNDDDDDELVILDLSAVLISPNAGSSK